MKTVYAIVGAALIVLGGVVLFRGLFFTQNETVFQVGNLKAEVRKEERIPSWAGGVAIAAGLVLVVMGLRK
ncbi:hypothetical protein [Caldimonas sp.]|uniref:hypothetical protein n=1 Tax=Caldimonas sp. TaxID=2838790 RepID=UPI00391D210C